MMKFIALSQSVSHSLSLSDTLFFIQKKVCVCVSALYQSKFHTYRFENFLLIHFSLYVMFGQKSAQNKQQQRQREKKHHVIFLQKRKHEK